MRPLLHKEFKKGWLHLVHKNVKLYGISFTLMSVFINSLKIINGLKIVFLCYL